MLVGIKSGIKILKLKSISSFHFFTAVFHKAFVLFPPSCIHYIQKKEASLFSSSMVYK